MTPALCPRPRLFTATLQTDMQTLDKKSLEIENNAGYRAKHGVNVRVELSSGELLTVLLARVVRGYTKMHWTCSDCCAAYAASLLVMSYRSRGRQPYRAKTKDVCLHHAPAPHDWPQQGASVHPGSCSSVTCCLDSLWRLAGCEPASTVH